MDRARKNIILWMEIPCRWLLPRYDIPQPVVVERNVCNTLLTLSGYCDGNACPASFICTSQAPGIFPAIIKELSVGRHHE